MSKFSISVDGVPEFSRAFNRGVDRLKDLTPVFEELGQEFYEIEREQFISEGAPGQSGKWKELSSPYAELKAARWGDKNILEASGRLYNSITGKGSDNVNIIRKDEASFGTAVPYAMYHQKGTSKMPAREIISLTEQQKKRLTKRMQKKIVELMREAGLMRSR